MVVPYRVAGPSKYYKRQCKCKGKKTSKNTNRKDKTYKQMSRKLGYHLIDRKNQNQLCAYKKTS